MVGLDGSLTPSDATVLRAAVALARDLSGDLHVVRPWSWMGESILASPTRGLSPSRRRALLTSLQADHEARLSRFVRTTIGTWPGSSKPTWW